MDRRSFLKALGVGAVVAADPLGIVTADAATKTTKKTTKPAATTAPTTAAPAPTTATTQKKRQSSKVEKLRQSGGVFGYPTPFAYLRGVGLIHCLFMFDTLVWRDASGATIPWLAKDWEKSRDGLTWTFTLRDGVRFHDGKPLTADDVAFTFDYIKNGAGKGASGFIALDPVAKVTAVGRNKVVFTLDTPYAPFETLVAGRTPILPKHIWESVTDPAKFRGDKALIGSGPYKADVIDDAKQTYRYVANDDFFLGVPYVGALEFVPARDELAALDQNQLDLANVTFEEGVPDAVLAKYRKDPTYDILSTPGEYGRALHVNMSKGFPFNTVEFRQAIAYAIDREDIVRRLLLSQGDIASLGGLSPSHQWLAPNLPAYAYNPAKAIALLDQIGLKSNGGVRFSTTMLTSARDSTKTAEIVKEYLRAVGINVNVNLLDIASADDATGKGNYNLGLISYPVGGDPDSLRTRFSSKVRSQSFSRSIGWSNAAFETAAANQLAALTQDKRREAVVDMQVAVAQELPAIGLYIPDRLAVFKQRTFNAWYYTQGGVFGGFAGVNNKHVFVTGRQTGF